MNGENKIPEGEQGSDPNVLDMCCGKQKCPVATLQPDGSVVLTDVDESGQSHRIAMSSEQFGRLATFMERSSV